MNKEKIRYVLGFVEGLIVILISMLQALFFTGSIFIEQYDKYIFNQIPVEWSSVLMFLSIYVISIFGIMFGTISMFEGGIFGAIKYLKGGGSE